MALAQACQTTLTHDQAPSPVSIVIPTYAREEVLLTTISALLTLEHPANELIVVDQTQNHHPKTTFRLQAWNTEGTIRWLQRPKPSITEAMNHGLEKAKNRLVLFLDDDIIPHEDLVLNHSKAHKNNSAIWASVGQVIQPWQKAEAKEPPRKLSGLRKDFDFPFNSTLDAYVENIMAGNLCVNRQRAIAIGGFDENFVGAAYRFETEFARRIVKAGGKIRFVGAAGIDHLRAKSGGTRSEDNHLTSASPLHGFGDYYYAFLHGKKTEAWAYSVSRILREIRTKFHLTHPWWIPIKLTGEIRAFWAGRKQARLAAKLMVNRRAF
jgi:GT2 family glycosyltransferase